MVVDHGGGAGSGSQADSEGGDAGAAGKHAVSSAKLWCCTRGCGRSRSCLHIRMCGSAFEYRVLGHQRQAVGLPRDLDPITLERKIHGTACVGPDL